MGISLGPRYIFFKSLKKAESSSYHGALATLYKDSKEVAQGYEAQIQSIFNNQPESDKLNNPKFSEYINFIKEVEAGEREVELNFVNAVQRKMDQDKVFKRKFPGLQKLLKSILGQQSFSQTEYVELFSALTNYFNKRTGGLKAKRFAQDLLRTQNRIKISSDLIAAMGEEYAAELQEVMAENYSQYVGRIQKLISEAIKRAQATGDKAAEATLNSFYQKMLSEAISEKVNSILVNMGREHIDKMFDLVMATFKSKLNGKGKNYTEAEITDAIIEIVIQHIMDNLTLDDLEAKVHDDTRGVDTFVETILSGLDENKIYAYVSKGQESVVDQYVTRTLEESRMENILTKALFSGRDLANEYLLHTSQEDQEYIEAQMDTELKDKLGRARAAFEAAKANGDPAKRIQGLKGQISKILRQYFVAWATNNGLSDILTQAKDETKKSLRKRIQQQAKQITQAFFKKTKRSMMQQIKEKIKQNLKVRSTVGSTAEMLVAEVLSQLLGNPKLFGKDFQLKTDVSIIFELAPLDLEFAMTGLSQKIMDIINQTQENFAQIYSKETQDKKRDETSVRAAIDAWTQAQLKQQEQITRILNEAHLSAEQRAEVEERLQEWFANSFLLQIQVKDYRFYADQIGFHGGSLGASTQKIIENISTMYELGGLTKDDVELLAFAIHNCSADTWLGEGLKEDLATYLLGGAALIMFDDSFTSIKAFLDKAKEEIGIQYSMNTVHLYHLNNGMCVPASYVYKQIYQNLVSFYDELAQLESEDIVQMNRNNKVVIINNLTESEDKAKFDLADIGKNEKGSRQWWNYMQRRWNTTADTGEKKVKVEFIFLGGLLDMFDSLIQVFNVS